MQQGVCSGAAASFSCSGTFQNNTSDCSALDESILTNSVLTELKKQSPDGCLLCSFDAWDEEDWD
jgi:hypothetical protein